MSFFKKLFGGGSGDAKTGTSEAVVYKEYSIVSAPMAEGGQHRLCAIVTKEIDGEMREHRLIRADLFTSADEASEAAIRKAKRAIDEQGDAIFR